MVALNIAVNLKSLHSQFRRAHIRHTLKALRLHHKYSSKSPNLNFANIKLQPFFCHFAKFNARQFSAIRYVAMVMPILYDNFYSPIDSNLKYESCRLYG